MKQPYIQLLDQRGNFNVWRVDGEYVRDNINEQFTNAGQPLHETYIPKNEIWIDREAAGDESRFLIDGELEEYKRMAAGEDYETAHAAADDIVRRERKRATAGDVSGTNEAMPSVYLGQIGETDDGIKVWLVHGKEVRDEYDVDFTEGGHGRVYKYIPDDEVWIDDDVEPDERLYILLHELHEFHKMGDGWNYEHAHADASRVEWYCRHHPEELDDYLEAEGWIGDAT